MTLPRGWAQTTLGEVADFVMGQAPPGQDCNTVGVGTPFVKAGEFGPERPLIKEWTTKPLKLASTADVLICVVGATAGKVNLGADCAIGRSVAAIRPGGASTADFVHARMKLEVQKLRQASTGTAQGVISREMLAQVATNLPPIAEQGRIVAKLDALTARIARVRAELEKASRSVSRFRARAVSSVFSDAESSRTPLSELLIDIRYGTTKRCDYESGETPVLRIPNVQSGRIELRNIKFADFDDKELSKLALELGDILVIRSNGSISLVGRSAVVSESERGMLYAGYLIRLRLNLMRCLPEYLHFFLQSETARKALETAARSTSGVHNINTEHLRSWLYHFLTFTHKAKR